MQIRSGVLGLTFFSSADMETPQRRKLQPQDPGSNGEPGAPFACLYLLETHHPRCLYTDRSLS
jgi:hypothetical protein